MESDVRPFWSPASRGLTGLACIITAAGALVWYGRTTDAIKPECGPASLYVALSSCGKKVSWQAVVGLLDPTGKHRIQSMEDLAEAANYFGVRTRGVQANLDWMQKQDCVAVLELKNCHFVALLGFKKSAPLISDPLFPGDKSTAIWSRAKLEDCWTGRALLFGPDNTSQG